MLAELKENRKVTVHDTVWWSTAMTAGGVTSPGFDQQVGVDGRHPDQAGWDARAARLSP